jgi:hypothetical protein
MGLLLGRFSAWWLLCGVLLSVGAWANESTAPARGLKTVTITDEVGQSIDLYSGSYALVIGMADYTNGWPDLESIEGELETLNVALEKQGFKVEQHLNVPSNKIKGVYEDFIDRYGLDEENRLLFFYAGHGYTRKNGNKGYVVPVDAPNPEMDEKGFIRKSLGMNQILTWARNIESKHAMFLFDSCFSGAIFKARALPKHPPQISRLTAKPVRQFITAGNAGETVPAQSVFLPAFIDALEYGLGDLNKDGYVSGSELGMYLQNKVPQYSAQTPQFGKITDYDLSRGDFVFPLKTARVNTTPQAEPARSLPLVVAPVLPAEPITENRFAAKDTAKGTNWWLWGGVGGALLAVLAASGGDEGGAVGESSGSSGGIEVNW